MTNLVVGIILGGFLGYLVFWFFYSYRDIVKTLRKQLKELNSELQKLNLENEKYQKENEFLKLNADKILKENEELTKVVSELSKYYYFQLEAYKKSQELLNFLKQPDPALEGIMKKYMEENKDDEDKEEKKFF